MDRFIWSLWSDMSDCVPCDECVASICVTVVDPG